MKCRFARIVNFTARSWPCSKKVLDDFCMTQSSSFVERSQAVDVFAVYLLLFFLILIILTIGRKISIFSLTIVAGTGGAVLDSSISSSFDITAWWMFFMRPWKWGTYSRNFFTFVSLATSFLKRCPCPSSTTLINLSISLS